MNAVGPIHRLHEHRAWVNENLRVAALAVDDERLRRPLAIGQGSIWKSLLHMYAAEYVWLECLKDHEQALIPGDVPNKLPGNQEATGGVGSLAELVEKWRQLEDRWREYLQSLSTANLEQGVAKVSSNGKRTVTRRVDILLHVCTHAHYTTAQVLNMFRQVGSTSLPEVMLIALAREQAAQVQP
jgi:uncharacterized damage-inducible protein DinB